MTLLGVPNFAEGRDGARIASLRSALASRAGLLDVHSDAVHDRTVFTLAAPGESLAEALIAGAATALAKLDLREYVGAHPCIGALDVCPFVWLDEGERSEAEKLARETAARIGAELAIPVFLYGSLASAEERRERAFFRNGGAAELERRMGAGDLVPDFGPELPHPSAGATLVTARAPLAAFNLELGGGEAVSAREIAAELREAGGGLPGVRAIAIELAPGRLQISTNIHDPIATPLVEVIAATDRLARHRGCWVSATEIVGLVPAAAMAGFPENLLPPGFNTAERVIERRLEALDQQATH